MKVVRAAAALLFVCVSAGFCQQPQLPPAFAGWIRSNEPVAQDLASPLREVFQEFHLSGSATARYKQNGNELTLHEYEFPDTTGSYGAFTFLRESNMLPQKIGSEAASGNNRVVFYRGNVAVDCQFDRVTAMTLSQLRDLSRELPVRPNPGNLPALPHYLPTDNLAQSSVRYAVGPAGAQAAGVPLTAAQLAFDKSPEIVTAVYGTPSAPETLTLVSYPTPQIAGDQMRKLQPALDGDHLRRSHSILVIASGSATPQDAKALINFVNYDADLTWNEATKLAPRDNVFGLLANVIILSGVLVAFMLVLGLSFGGFRWFYYRLYPEKAAAREEAQQMIRLNL